MTFKETYNSIDQTQLPEKAKKYMEDFKNDSNNFKDEEAMAKMLPALNKFIDALKKSGYESAIKTPEAKKEEKPKKEKKEKVVKKTPVQKTKEEVEKAVEQPKTEKDKPKIGKLSKGYPMQLAKEIRKEGESWGDAMKRARQMINEQKQVVKKEAERQYEKLKRYIRLHPEVYPKDIPTGDGSKRATNLKRDIVREAMPKGARISKKGWKNQWGESKGGRKYYEYRSNRYDTRKKYPYLADGGEIEHYEPMNFHEGDREMMKSYSKDGLYQVKGWQDESSWSEGNSTDFMRFNDLEEAKYWANALLDENSFGWYATEVYDTKDGETIYHSEGEYSNGGEINERMYNFLVEDLASLQVAINENDTEKIEQFFSYWNIHLKSLKPEMSSARIYYFLEDDLAKLESAINNNDKEEIEKFFSYWDAHLSKLKYAKGGGVEEFKIGDWVKEKNGNARGKIWETMGYLVKLEDAYGNKSDQYYRTDRLKHSSKPKQYKVEYAKGGEIKYESMVLKYDYPKYRRKPATTVYLRPDLSKVIKVGGRAEDGYHLIYKDGNKSSIVITQRELDELKNGATIESSGATVTLSDKYAKGGTMGGVSKKEHIKLEIVPQTNLGGKSIATKQDITSLIRAYEKSDKLDYVDKISYDFQNDMGYAIITDKSKISNFINILDAYNLQVSPYQTYSKGGSTDEVVIGDYKKNILGTLSFNLKLPNMRKSQDFSVYPVSEKSDYIDIQSGTRFGKIQMTTGRGLMTQSHPNGAYAVHMHIDKLVKFTLTESQLDKLKEELAKTAGSSVGSSVIKSDNTYADKFAKGGYVEEGEDYEYVNTFGIDQDDFEKLVDAYHKSPSYDQAERVESRLIFRKMREKYGESKIDEIGNYIHETHESHEHYAKGGMFGAGNFADGGETDKVNIAVKTIGENKYHIDVNGKSWSKKSSGDLGDVIINVLFYVNKEGDKKIKIMIDGKDETVEFKKAVIERYEKGGLKHFINYLGDGHKYAKGGAVDKKEWVRKWLEMQDINYLRIILTDIYYNSDTIVIRETATKEELINYIMKNDYDEIDLIYKYYHNPNTSNTFAKGGGITTNSIIKEYEVFLDNEGGEMLNDDLKSHKAVLKQIKNGDLKKAYMIWIDMNTEAREHIPKNVYKLITKNKPEIKSKRFFVKNGKVMVEYDYHAKGGMFGAGHFAEGGEMESKLRKRFESYSDEELQVFNGDNSETLKNWNREDAINEAVQTSLEEAHEIGDDEYAEGGQFFNPNELMLIYLLRSPRKDISKATGITDYKQLNDINNLAIQILKRDGGFNMKYTTENFNQLMNESLDLYNKLKPEMKFAKGGTFGAGNFAEGGEVKKDKITLIFNGKEHHYPIEYIDNQVEDVELKYSMVDNPLWDYLESEFYDWLEHQSRDYEEMYFGEEAIYDVKGAIRGAIEVIDEVIYEEAPKKTTFNLDKGDVDFTTAFQ